MKPLSLILLSTLTLAACDKTAPADKAAQKMLTELRTALPECDPMWVTTLKAIDDKRAGQEGFAARADAIAAIDFFEKMSPVRDNLDEKFAAYVAEHAKDLESHSLVARTYDAPCDSFHRFGVIKGLIFSSTKLFEAKDQARVREQTLRYVERGSFPWLLDVGLRARTLANTIEQKVIPASAEIVARVNALNDTIKQKAEESSQAQKQMNLPNDLKGLSSAQRKALLSHFADEAAFAVTQQAALRAIVKDLRGQN